MTQNFPRLITTWINRINTTLQLNEPNKIFGDGSLPLMQLNDRVT